MRTNKGFLELRRLEAAREIANMLGSSNNRVMLDSQSLLLNGNSLVIHPDFVCGLLVIQLRGMTPRKYLRLRSEDIAGASGSRSRVWHTDLLHFLRAAQSKMVFTGNWICVSVTDVTWL